MVNQKAAPNNWQSKVMNQIGIFGIWPTDYRTDKRFVLQKVESNGNTRADLLTFDPTLAKNRWDYIFTFGKYMKFDWLYASKIDGYITYRIDAVKV